MKTLFFIALIATAVYTEETTTTDDNTSNANGTCKEGTDEYCARCVSDKCSVCYNSSLTMESGVCTAVDPEVADCMLYSPDSKDCLSCVPKDDKPQYLASNKCNEIDISGCLSQTDADTCAFCDGVFVKDKKCEGGDACSTHDENCEQCMMVGEAKMCVACKSGFKTSEGKCVEGEETTTELKTTSEGCEDSTDGKCVQCKYGYYVNSKSADETMTCAKSTRYESVAIIKTIALALFAIALF